MAGGLGILRKRRPTNATPGSSAEMTSWPRIPSTTLADRVYRAVRARVMDGQVRPGEFMREKALNEAMGVSRTPIREALSRLASEGFLEKIPHRGFRIPDEPVGSLLELYPIVAALDLLAGRLALPRLTGRDISRLREINGKLTEADARHDVQALIEFNNQFHHLFSERSGNVRLCSLLDDLRMQVARLERWYYSYGAHAEQSIRQHDEIIEAVEAEDYSRALELLEKNMYLTYESLVEDARSASP
jgi:DNA-binding GntR family transcriptional regulator